MTPEDVEPVGEVSDAEPVEGQLTLPGVIEYLYGVRGRTAELEAKRPE